MIPGAASGFRGAPQASLTPSEAERPLSLEERIAQAEAIKAQTREVERITARLGRERQFNKRVAINAALRDAKLELERLIVATAQPAATSE